MAPLEILIVGCSIAGPALATCLLLSDVPVSQKPHITVLERSNGMRTEGQNIDVRGAGVTILRRLGIEKAVRAKTTREEGVRMVDSRNRTWGQFVADKSGKTSTPTADIEILRGTLAKILFQRARSVSDAVQAEGGHGVEFVWADTLDAIEQDGLKVHVHFAKSGKTKAFDLVVGADGLQSTTRSMAWGPQADDAVQKLAGGVYGAFFSIPAWEADEETLWRKWYHASGRRSIMVRPHEQRGRATAFMTVIADTDARLERAATNKNNTVAVQKALMKEYFGEAGWECERVVDDMMQSTDFYYDSIAQVKLDHWSKGRVVLLGDAGYCASAFSGMGTTLGLIGAWKLAGCIFQHPNDPQRAFDLYEARMQPTVALAQKLAPGFPRSLHPATDWGVWLIHAFVWVLWVSRVFGLLMKLGAGPPAHSVQVEETQVH
ncbi:hypothetical protein BD289DRAFT_458670 [Coniella lustricola]|uniref:FAD-binding domain-containing protein n=1 Tax=Coniella lustricola TaxID=2025994 RepID=A0A2T3AI34_9PEZI|nr:hypothetical protein BD289DRAFT_458670 [Coniella lustricola]